MIDKVKEIFNRLKPSKQPRWLVQGLSLYKTNNISADKVLLNHLSQIQKGALAPQESRLLEEFRVVVELRALQRLDRESVEKETSFSMQVLQRAFLIRDSNWEGGPIHSEEINFDEITQAAQTVSGLLWQNHCLAQDHQHPLQSEAKSLLENLSGGPIEEVIEAMQKEGGIPFLLLNCVARKNWSLAKAIGVQLLSKEIFLEEESRVCLYWIAEILWFSKNQVRVSDFESTIRYLYHLCFINPERAGFLEIDSQFFSQFETVSELAQEGLLFKETLIDRILRQWEQHGKVFNTIFVEVMQLLTQQKNKIYQDLAIWQKWWEREKPDFEKAVLFCVEGNLHYSAGRFKEALGFYDRAMSWDAHLRPALLNRAFCFAQLKDYEGHRQSVEDLLSRHSLFPSNKIAAAHSYLLMDQKDEAQILFTELAHEVDGWEKKAEYYQSIFCLEHGLIEPALHFAKLAYEKAPEDQRYGFHLSRCLKEAGKTEEALNIVRALSLTGPEWLLFYRFTLERDAGLIKDAQQTLSALSDEFFEDPEELQEALEFAKNTQDLSLLRRLKFRAS